MTEELPKQYDPSRIESAVYQRWTDSRAFSATPDQREDRYVIMMPLPNVTGALHMGHAMDNVMQDLLTRWHRMRQHNTLWMAGTDHAGIATQAVVEKRLFELEGKTRRDIGREALVERIWGWKEQYQARIVSQQQSMGCSCDWDRQRFTMDDVCARAVRHTFFNMFRDGLIYRGDRLVNWDCHLQTAIADDEIDHKKVDGHFWHLRYPVVDPKPGEPEYIVVATTRPETMLGDTAVACHPKPEVALERLIEETREKLAKASTKDRDIVQEELDRLEERKRTHLPQLIQFRDMARDGRQVMLPLLDRPIPIICDEWAKPELGSGCVKITPGHDPNDHEVFGRHPDIGLINILTDDGTLNANAGPYAKIDRLDARKKVVADLDKLGLLDRVEDRKIEIGHSDRSKTPIEPYMSKQWFVHMGDVDGGVLFGRGTDKEFRSDGLAQAAIDAVDGEWRSATDRKLSFYPDDRYARTYVSWLSEKRDWCISRQLWWGHQIPIWAKAMPGSDVAAAREQLADVIARDDVFARVSLDDGTSVRLDDDAAIDALDPSERHEILVCLLDRPTDGEVASTLESLGLVRDPDVLDTWFSSGLWPHSTLGWPDAATAALEDGQSTLGSVDGNPDCVDYFYPGSCLVTGRDIITLWVARMVLMGLYNIGDLPFTDCFIHANILDGKGEKMSKSKGNGIDPVDIIEKYGADAMRYVVCELQTGSQDIRLPVQAISPHTGETVDLATAKHGSTMFTYMCPTSGKEFDVLGTMEDVPAAKLVSDRFDVGRNFCNKVWNSGRFAFMNLDNSQYEAQEFANLPGEDRWVLSRLSAAIGEINQQLERYNPSAAIGAAREFFWSELCDWYLELIKPRMRDAQQAALASQVLAAVFDQVLRLLHPFVPFITEELWAKLGELAPTRGIDRPLAHVDSALIRAEWPQQRPEWRDEALEQHFSFLQEMISGIRDVRHKYNVPGEKLDVAVRASGDRGSALTDSGELITNLANLASFTVDPEATRGKDAATVVIGDVELFIAGVVDLEKEKERLAKQREQLVKRIEGSKKKLGNENFVSRAKPEIVERERELVVDLERQLTTLDETIADL